MRRVFATAPGRVIVTTFSSHIHRVQGVLDAAYEDARSVALLGRSLNRNAGIAIDLGLPHEPRRRPGQEAAGSRAPSPRRAGHRLHGQPGRDDGGPQPRRARRASADPDPGRATRSSSRARTVPGNEIAVNDTINRLITAGARVMTEESDPDIHVSGHGSAADLLLMLQLIRPKFFAPIHGEPRHQKAHADLAMSVGITPEQIAIMSNGDLLEVDAESFGVVDRVPSGITYVDRMGGRRRRRGAAAGSQASRRGRGGHDRGDDRRRGRPVVGDVDVVARALAADDELIEEVAVDVDNALQDACRGAARHRRAAAQDPRRRRGVDPQAVRSESRWSSRSSSTSESGRSACPNAEQGGASRRVPRARSPLRRLSQEHDASSARVTAALCRPSQQ